jgi:hypothetical protein
MFTSKRDALEPSVLDRILAVYYTLLKKTVAYISRNWAYCVGLVLVDVIFIYTALGFYEVLDENQYAKADIF